MYGCYIYVDIYVFRKIHMWIRRNRVFDFNLWLNKVAQIYWRKKQKKKQKNAGMCC